MIGNEDGSKSNVLVQWVSRDYLIQNKKELKDIPVGPDEYFVLLKKGKIEEFATQSQVNAVPGLLRRFMDFIGTKSDVQLVIIDTRKHTISVPFEAYSRDRDLIRGGVELFANISKDNATLALRLLKENGEFSSSYNEMGFRQFCLEDLTELIRKNVQYIVDTEAISGYDASEIQSKRSDICTDIISALNSKTPYWANYGLNVSYSSVVIDENEYERLERLDMENRLKSRQSELDYAEAQGVSEHTIRMKDLVNRESAALEMNAYLSKVGLEASKEAKAAELAHEKKLRDMGYEEDEATRAIEAHNRLEMLAIYHQRELRRIEDEDDLTSAEKAVKMKEVEARLASVEEEISRKKFDFEMYMQDEREKRRRDSKRTDDDIELSRKERETDIEIKKKRAEAEILMTMSERDDIRQDKALDYGHEEKLSEIDSKTKIASYQSDAARFAAEGEAKAKAEALENFKEAISLAHQQNLDNAAMTERMIYAASGKAAPEKPVNIVCPKCGMSLDPRSKFCGGCGAKLGGGDE